MSNTARESAQLAAEPIDLSFPLPRGPETRIHLQLTIHETSLLLFLTTVNSGEISSAAPLGSFVYALIDRYNPAQAISTPLCTNESTIDFTTRIAKTLARKTAKPVYVGNSISFAGAGLGGTVEEEIEGFKKVVEIVMNEVKKSKRDNHAPVVVHGINGH